jgi:hypothetical protein
VSGPHVELESRAHRHWRPREAIGGYHRQFGVTAEAVHFDGAGVRVHDPVFRHAEVSIALSLLSPRSPPSVDVDVISTTRSGAASIPRAGAQSPATSGAVPAAIARARAHTAAHQLPMSSIQAYSTGVSVSVSTVEVVSPPITA